MRYVIVLGVLILFFISHIALAQPVINEVMPHTNQSWGEDWVELYNPTNDTLVLVGWNINDTSSNDTISLNISAGEFGLIVDNDTQLGNATGCAAFNVSSVSCIELAAIGGGLAAPGDTVFLYNDTSTLIDNFSWAYNIQINGTSWGRSPDGGNWTTCTPTPGSANNCTVGGNQTNDTNVVLEIVIDPTVVINASYDLFNITIDGSCSFSYNVTIGYNITADSFVIEENSTTVSVNCSKTAVSWRPNATGEYKVCGWINATTANNNNTDDDSDCKNITVVDAPPCDLAVSISAPTVHDLGINRTLKYNITVNDSAINCTTHPINVTYWIDDLFGENVDSPYTTQNKTMCSGLKLTPQFTSWPDVVGSEAFLIKANITMPGCNDTAVTNNYAERLLVVKENRSSSSWINITDVSPSSVKWGESFDVELEVYRGNTSEDDVDIYVNGTSGTASKVSDETTIHTSERYTIYELMVPVQLKPNCDGDWPDGTYKLVASGLGQTATKNVSISGISSSTCENVTSSSGSSGGGGSECPQVLNESVGEDSNFYFVRAPSEVGIGQTFETVVRVKNNATTRRNLTIYAYAFDGNKLLSDGKANGTWQGDWEANAQTISLGAGESTNIGFMNKIKTNVTAGTYKLRVRIKDVKDLTRSLKITENATLEGCGICSCSAEPSESEGAENVTLNRTRRTINYEDPIEVIKNSVSEAITGFATSTADIARLVTERFPKPDFTLVPRIVAGTWEGFISAIEQIIRSS